MILHKMPVIKVQKITDGKNAGKKKMNIKTNLRFIPISDYK